MTTTITLRDLTKQFPAPAGGRTTAVDRVSLTIPRGEMFFLLGPSGCGKTTLLRMIAGFIEPTSGQVLFEPDGQAARDVTYLPPNQRNTGMVFQSYALWPHMSVAKNVAFGLEVRKVSAEERERRVREALTMVRMESYADRKPTQLSGGQQQRVALARALVIRPDVLLLDEPLSNLDAKLRIELRSEIRRICKQVGGSGRDQGSTGSAGGMTTIYVTHDQKEALSMADRIAIVSQGRVVQMGPPQELYRRPATRFVAEFLGETNFVEGTLVERSGDHARVRTALGELFASASSLAPSIAPGASVACSIRPEVLHIASGQSENTFEATIEDSTYLGETAQLVVKGGAGAAGPMLSVAVLNPGSAWRVGDRVALHVARVDVMVLE